MADSHLSSVFWGNPCISPRFFPPKLIKNKDEEPFNPDYVEVDRILDESHSVDKDNGEVSGERRKGKRGRGGTPTP